MYREHTIGVVVPAYNEEGLISDVIWTMPDYVDWIYAIDDCSTDGTWEEIQHAAHEDAIETEGGGQIGRERALQSVRADGGVGDLLTDRARIHSPIGRVVPIQHHENMGAGGAIKTGYLAALKDELDITVTMDGDGQMDPRLREGKSALVQGVSGGNVELPFLGKFDSHVPDEDCQRLLEDDGSSKWVHGDNALCTGERRHREHV